MEQRESSWPIWRKADAHSRAKVCGLTLLMLGGSLGCQSGAPGNPFQSGPTRIPAPATRSLQSNGNYYNGPAGAPGGAIGTGITGGANWSSTPGTVNAANSTGVYTSFLERTGTGGYNVRSVPGGSATPASGSSSTPNLNTRSSAPVDPRFPATTFGNPGSQIQRTEFQQPLPTQPPSFAPLENPRYADPQPYVPPTDAAPAPPPSAPLQWRMPRP